ncbi:hypothetical protein [Anaerophilus nitritogenes]|uniref:hypothetical protein n=1 Tax=Anaerophilus nitritogenes TaxID=2498136 RepID=UPI0013EA3D84|nr:hypothetical protein [Anaerophilus nitritogenes]
MENKIKTISAIVFQFTIVAILTFCLVTKIGDPETIIGALIGLAVGIGINSISE